VQGQYDSDFRNFGETYARGDGIAREQLKDVLITLQMAVSSNLTAVWMGVRPLDYTTLLIASDDSRVNATSCLIQWRQRLSSAAAAQQQSSTPYQLGLNARPMTPPLTNASNCSDRSSPTASCLLTSNETSGRGPCLNLAARSPESGYASPVNFVQSGHALPRTEGRGDIEMPSPLFARARLSLSRENSLVSLDFPQEVPVRSPNRPKITTSRDAPQSRTMTASLGQAFPSPISAANEENEHLERGDFSRPCQPQSLDSTTISSMHSYSSTANGSIRAMSSGSRASQAQPTFSDHSTLEPVSVLDSSDVHPADRNDLRQQQSPKASSTSALIRGIPQHLASAAAGNPQSNPNHRTSAQIPVPDHRSRTSTNTNINHSTAFTSRTSLPIPLTLPSDSNSYLGFCKGAYRLQIGLSPRKAFDVETRPAGLYSTFQVWRCSKCRFEGPLYLTAGLPGCGKKAGKPERMFDPKVRTSEGGIAYRWAFLAKSHLTTRETVDGVKDGSFGSFGCLFCCAEGVERGWVVKEQQHGEDWVGPAEAAAATAGGKRKKGAKCTSTSSTSTSSTPMFGNVESLMQHLEMHRTVEGTPGVEMQGRMKCVVGRIAEPGEDFDINLPPVD
jgi:hypothetical protein